MVAQIWSNATDPDREGRAAELLAKYCDLLTVAEESRSADFVRRKSTWTMGLSNMCESNSYGPVFRALQTSFTAAEKTVRYV